jgi:hypothetical protein
MVIEKVRFLRDSQITRSLEIPRHVFRELFKFTEVDVVRHKPIRKDQILSGTKPLLETVDYGYVIVDRTDESNISVGVEDGVYGILCDDGVYIIL